MYFPWQAILKTTPNCQNLRREEDRAKWFIEATKFNFDLVQQENWFTILKKEYWQEIYIDMTKAITSKYYFLSML